MADKLDIEETNRVRLSLGMAPLPVPEEGKSSNGLNFKKSGEHEAIDDEDASTLETRHAAASSNWQKLQDGQQDKKKREDRKGKLRKEREAAQRFAKLEGKGLGEEDDDDLDTRSWLLGAGKRQDKIEKERAKQLERELAERERQANIHYTEKDLAGARVGHELGDFDEGGEKVLTLKDAAVDAASDEDDELENLNMKEDERRQKRLELKKKRPEYDPNNEEQTGGILSKYDEEIQGRKKSHFTLSGNGLPAGIQFLSKTEESVPGRTKINLDFMNEERAPISDYQDVPEVKIKKSKKKKDKTKHRKPVDDDGEIPLKDDNVPSPNLDSMDIDEGRTNGRDDKKRKANDNAIDDADLQSRLTEQRQSALKKRKKMRPEDLARQMREEAAEEPHAMDIVDPGDDDGLVFDETSRFVDALQKREPTPERRTTLQPSAADSPRNSPQPDTDTRMADTDADPDPVASPLKEADDEDALGAEANLNAGVGAALNMLTSRGIIKTAASGDLNAQHRERQRFLAEKHKREADAEGRARLQRERDRASGKLDRMSVRERDAYAAQQNAMRDQQESRQAAEVFNREYKPNVELKYTDEFGRRMNEKEAFKHLSHQFHGKGSGKQKTEKMLKKVEAERKEAGRSLLDAGAEDQGLGRARGMQARKRGQAGVRLQ